MHGAEIKSTSDNTMCAAINAKASLFVVRKHRYLKLNTG